MTFKGLNPQKLQKRRRDYNGMITIKWTEWPLYETAYRSVTACSDSQLYRSIVKAQRNKQSRHSWHYLDDYVQYYIFTHQTRFAGYRLQQQGFITFKTLNDSVWLTSSQLKAAYKQGLQEHAGYCMLQTKWWNTSFICVITYFSL